MIAWRSTRGGSETGLATALLEGLAADGGLYVPSRLPRFEAGEFAHAESASDVAAILLRPFFDGSVLSDSLTDICTATFDFPLPLRRLGRPDDRRFMLELFHGPTAAFKDVGARFLARSLVPLVRRGDDARAVTILVATSGDTGGAVAAAFHKLPGFEVCVLFPLGRVSARQQHQLTCWGDNVAAYAVRGSFDDCQRIVKTAFSDPVLAGRYRFSSANSINIGRLLPQTVYYAHASLAHERACGRPLSFVIPTGNLGNGLACVLARAMGLPIGDIVFATNANRTLPDFLDNGTYTARESVATLASAMDVGDPSNIERLTGLFGGAAALNSLLQARSVGDADIERQIRKDYERYGRTFCPHTATAMYVYDGLPPKARDGVDWAIVATAHAAKFESIVEPLIGAPVEIPESLSRLLERKSTYVEIDSDLASFSAALAKRGD